MVACRRQHRTHATVYAGICRENSNDGRESAVLDSQGYIYVFYECSFVL